MNASEEREQEAEITLSYIPDVGVVKRMHGNNSNFKDFCKDLNSCSRNIPHMNVMKYDISARVSMSTIERMWLRRNVNVI